MAPLTPFWAQPSHGERLEVVVGKEGFTSKSISKIALPPFGLFSKLSFPPCTLADEPTYATVQMGRDAHLNLNSDLLYINHSCDPSLVYDGYERRQVTTTHEFQDFPLDMIFDIPTRSVLAGPRGLHPGAELTFFYPSTEWSMAQPFECFCGAPTCRGMISGANEMTPKQLEGLWLNGFIREMLEEKRLGFGHALKNGKLSTEANGHSNLNGHSNANAGLHGGTAPVSHGPTGARSHSSARNGPTSRELSGEMGGDTNVTSLSA